jgi:nicotinate phosphoribosyltransferase
METARPESVGLVADLYELTMAKSYLELGMNARATFSLFVRKLPKARSYLVACGLEEALRRLEHFGFDARGVNYLVSTGRLRRDQAEALARTRFTGNVRAVPEGRVVFANEPLLEVDAPLVEAELAETLVLNALHFPTAVATKASRCVTAARGRSVVDFGLRRTPGIEAGLAVARACWLAGFSATSNVQAGEELGIPISGTVAHAFVSAFPSERAAFDAWARTSDDPITLLVDTYDTQRGVRRAIELGEELRAHARKLGALRLDSGDLDALSRIARRMLDAAGFTDVKLFASGGLDEYALDALMRAGAPIDGFGVGTRIGTSADAPVLDMAYKLVEYDGRATLKLSEGKATLVGPKQVYRRRDAHGRFCEDRIACADEPLPRDGEWEPLLEQVMRGGEKLSSRSLADARETHAKEMRALPERISAIDPRGAPREGADARASYRVAISATLEARQRAAIDTAQSA